MAGEFEGKVVMITGANGGLGSGVVQRFAAAGARLALVVRRKGDEDLCGGASECLVVEADVTDKASIQNAVDQIAARFGQIDALVHTVGGFASGSPVSEVDLDVFDKMLTLNTRSFYVTAGTVARYMLDKGVSGSITVILARNALEGRKNSAAYGASKAAVQRIMESMSKELLDAGIRVNGVIPGTIDTPANRADMPDADFSKWVQPEDIADTLLFLTSPGAAPVSGASIPVYGRS